jgi:PST family polysaccharide transporter
MLAFFCTTTQASPVTTPSSVLAALAIILLDLTGRAGLDKMLAWTSTPETIALWAQLQSVVDLVVGVAAAGVIQGLSVMVAQARSPLEAPLLLRHALKLGLFTSLCLALLVMLFATPLSTQLTQGNAPASLFWITACSGCLTVLPATLNGYWLGQHQQLKMLLLACLGSLVWVAVALAAWLELDMQVLLLMQCLALAVIAVLTVRHMYRLTSYATLSGHAQTYSGKLAAFIPVGLSIGILSPASMLLIRSLLSSTLSWHDVGVLQALWRTTDWVTATAAGVLSLVFLPRFSNTYGYTHFKNEVIRAGLLVSIPTAGMLLLIWTNQRHMLAALYDARFAISDATVWWFVLGCWLRILSWVFLFGLFAAHRTRLIAAGEFCSLPLYALLLWLFADGMTLERAAQLFAASYLAYLAFNALALLWARQTAPPAHIPPTVSILPPPG